MNMEIIIYRTIYSLAATYTVILRKNVYCWKENIKFVFVIQRNQRKMIVWQRGVKSKQHEILHVLLVFLGIQKMCSFVIFLQWLSRQYFWRAMLCYFNTLRSIITVQYARWYLYLVIQEAPKVISGWRNEILVTTLLQIFSKYRLKIISGRLWVLSVSRWASNVLSFFVILFIRKVNTSGICCRESLPDWTNPLMITPEWVQ